MRHPQPEKIGSHFWTATLTTFWYHVTWPRDVPNFFGGSLAKKKVKPTFKTERWDINNLKYAHTLFATHMGGRGGLTGNIKVLVTRQNLRNVRGPHFFGVFEPREGKPTF